MYEAQVEVKSVPGIHARPAALLVQKASQFKAEIFFATEHMSVNGKSIMGVMMFAAETGTLLTIRGNGPDEQTAVDTLIAMIDSGFEEI